jgi:glucose 1-dehydrogenase
MPAGEKFNGKTVIVTGAGQGIGFVIANLLAAQGANVVLNDIDEKLASQAVQKIQDQGYECLSSPGNASEKSVIDNMIRRAVEKFGKLDISIANAGITLFGDFLSYPVESFNKVMQVNLAGTFFLAQASANQMKLQGNGGSLLFTSSVTAHQAHQNLAAYGMSKAAIEMLAKNLVVDLSPFGIRVNAIAPGATQTERTIHDTSYIDTWSRITPLGRPAGTIDIANAALFLISDEARHITGQTLIVDGGWTSVSPTPY